MSIFQFPLAAAAASAGSKLGEEWATNTELSKTSNTDYYMWRPVRDIAQMSNSVITCGDNMVSKRSTNVDSSFLFDSFNSWTISSNARFNTFAGWKRIAVDTAGGKAMIVGSNFYALTTNAASQNPTWTTYVLPYTGSSFPLERIEFLNNRWVSPSRNQSASIMGIQHSTDGINWTQVNISGFGDYFLEAATYSSSLNRYVFVGGSGRFAYTSDLISFNVSTLSDFGGSFNSALDVEWNGSVFCAVGDGGGIATSSDGITWTNRRTALNNAGWNNKTIRKVILDNVTFVILASDGTIGYSSDNGVSWSISTTVNNFAWSESTPHRVAALGTQFFSIAKVQIGLSGQPGYYNGFVLCGSNGVVLKSSSGTLIQDRLSGWNIEFNIPETEPYYNPSTSFSSDTYAYFGETSEINAIYIDDHPYQGNSTLVAYNDGNFGFKIARSFDKGATWQVDNRVANHHLNNYSGTNSDRSRDVLVSMAAKRVSPGGAQSQNGYVVALSGLGRVYTNSDITSTGPWTYRGYVSGSGNVAAYNIIWGPGFFLVGGASYNATSTDGVTWTVVSDQLNRGIRAIWTGLEFLSYSVTNNVVTIYTSTNGTTWTQKTTTLNVLTTTGDTLKFFTSIRPPRHGDPSYRSPVYFWNRVNRMLASSSDGGDTWSYHTGLQVDLEDVSANDMTSPVTLFGMRRAYPNEVYYQTADSLNSAWTKVNTSADYEYSRKMINTSAYFDKTMTILGERITFISTED